MTAAEQTIMARGVKLHIVSEGRGHPVVLLHGFTGTTRSLAHLAGGLRDAHRAIRIDLVGHGCSEAPRNILVTNDNTIIVKEQADGGIFEIDPATGLADQIARAGDLSSSPQSTVIAPSGYASVELAGVQPGDIVFAGDAGVSVIDRAAETGLKGGLDRSLFRRLAVFLTTACRSRFPRALNLLSSREVILAYSVVFPRTPFLSR